MQSDIIAMVNIANITRQRTNLSRRIMKVSEEAGEISEAYLNVTSKANPKNKTWKDIREEACDTAIIALDVALQRAPDEDALSDIEIYAEVLAMMEQKLAKWADKRARNAAITGIDEDDV